LRSIALARGATDRRLTRGEDSLGGSGMPAPLYLTVGLASFGTMTRDVLDRSAHRERTVG
jgi:hypothetical protein